MYNFVINFDYWDGIAKTDDFNRICDGYGKEEDFWAFQPDVQGWDLKKHMSFLDFGCGPGRIVKTIAPLVNEYIGVDVCEGLISKAKLYHKEYDNVKFFVNNGNDLSLFDDCMFDFAHEFLTFIHLRKELIVEFINEIYRVLKAKGVFLVRSLPKGENYVNGFSLEEIQNLFSIFKEMDIEDTGVRYCIRCVK